MDAMEEKISKVLSQMTLADKIRLCSGKNCWETKDFGQYDIPALWLSDGPNGLRKQEGTGDMLGLNEALPATCFPTSAAIGCSWDPDLSSAVGAAIAGEAAAQGVGVVLGPGANIKRNPLCGRNFEYYSEDPCLTGKLAAGFIQGVQKNGVGASLKHFAANSQENKRFNSDSVVEERTLREIYLTGFETAVKEGKPATVMCAYNLLNGTHCSNSRFLLTDVLRGEWGFDGAVVTDWGALYDRIEAFRAGCDLEMPGGMAFMEQEAWEAVQNGTLDEACVNESAARVLRLVLERHAALEHPTPLDPAASHALARRAAAESAVLLKNDGILPLNPDSRLGLIGHMAQVPRYQGAGSSHIHPIQLVSLTDVLPDLPCAPGCTEDGGTTPELLEQAVSLAKGVDTVVLCVGLPASCESEGYDRDTMAMPEGHLALIDAVTQANPNTVVLLYSGSAVEVPWLDQVRGLLYLGLPGEAGGEAAADLLFGRANPCGKLAETWPLQYADCVSSLWYGEKIAQYREGIYVGYRYYDKAGKDVRFPFGYGLSYTTFSYHNLRREGSRVSVDLTNTGTVPGAEVVEFYVSPRNSALHRPVRELRGFAKVYLEPGETKTAEFVLDERCFAVWQDGWLVPAGTYRLEVGASSRDIRCALDLQTDGAQPEVPDWQAGSWYETMEGSPSQALWEQVLGRPVPREVLKKGSYTLNNTVIEMKETSLMMKLLFKVIENMMAKQYGGRADYSLPIFRMMMAAGADCNIPGMVMNAGYRNYLLQGALDVANGHFFRGVKLMLRKFREPGV